MSNSKDLFHLKTRNKRELRAYTVTSYMLVQIEDVDPV